jgi:hypothetical protein
VKSLLNRRSASLAIGPSHLVQVAHDNPAHADDESSTAFAAAPTAAAARPAEPSEPAEPTRPVTALRPVPVVPSQVCGRAVQMADTAELEWLTEEEALTPFRVFRSFDYSVSLLFHARELAYYVALYQSGTLWRALKAADLDAAEAAFHHFEEQATRLSEGETRRALLSAQNEQLARMIAQSEARAERLRCDLQRNAVQEQTVTGRQHQLRKEVAQLEAQRVAAQAQLNKTHRQIHQLNLTSNEGLPHLPGR